MADTKIVYRSAVGTNTALPADEVELTRTADEFVAEAQIPHITPPPEKPDAREKSVVSRAPADESLASFQASSGH